jgi:zinc/manganese transport system substrate-binding protein/manganese/iron transport system substrate-binding protein
VERPQPSKRLSLNNHPAIGARLPTSVRALVVAILGVSLVAACGASGASAPPSAGLRVVVTTTVLADIVANVAGDAVDVRSIIPAGVGPEDYEPKPDDARALDGAALIVSNGVGLDDFLDRLLDANSGGDAPRLVLGDAIPAITVDGEPNPLFWLDPTLVIDHYLPAIEASLTQLDPSNAGVYAANALAYASALAQLDRELQADAGSVPEANRKLVTFHDAFPYFAAHFGFEVVGVILDNPGQEPSAGELASLVETVKASGVHAIFSESQFSPAVAETLAAEAGVTQVVTTLYNDALGPPPADTYLGLMRWNMDAITAALR